MGGDTGKKGEAKQKSKGKMLEQGPGGSASRSSLSFSNETKQQPHHHHQSAKLATATQVGVESKQEDHSSPFQNIINSSTVWNELVQQQQRDSGKGLAETEAVGTKSAEVMDTTMEKLFVSPCGFSSSSTTSNNSDRSYDAAPTISESEEIAKKKLSSSSAPYQRNFRQNTTVRDVVGHEDTRSISTTAATAKRLLVAADEDYDQSFVGHLSSDENEHLLPSPTKEEENEKVENGNGSTGGKERGKGEDIRAKRKSGNKRGSTTSKNDNINRTTTAGINEDDGTLHSKRPTSLTIPSSLIKDGKNGNGCEWKENTSPCTLSSSSSQAENSFFLFCLSGISRVLVILSIFSAILVVWLWFHTRLSYLEREVGLQKERIEILVENILDAERLLNRRSNFDLEEDEDEDFVEMERNMMVNDQTDSITKNLPMNPQDLDKSSQEKVDIGQQFMKMLGKAQRVR